MVDVDLFLNDLLRNGGDSRLRESAQGIGSTEGDGSP